MGKEATDAVLELGPLQRPGVAQPWHSRGSGTRGCLSYHKIPNLLSGSSSKATRSLRPTGVPDPPAGLQPGSPGSPPGIASCLQAAPKGQRGLGSAVSQPLRLPLIHFTLSILIGSALSPAPPAPSHALPPAGCCTAGQPGLQDPYKPTYSGKSMGSKEHTQQGEESVWGSTAQQGDTESSSLHPACARRPTGQPGDPLTLPPPAPLPPPPCPGPLRDGVTVLGDGGVRVQLPWRGFPPFLTK